MKRILIILALTALLFACDVLPDAPPANTNPADPENPESLYSPVNLLPAGGISFFDTNTAEDIIEGTITIAKAADETAVTGYRLYWSADGTTKLNNAPVVKDVVKTGSNIILTFGTETGNLITSVPVGATHLLIYTYYGDYEAETPYAYDIQDRVVEMVVDMLDGSGSGYPNELTEYNGKLYFKAKITSSGLEYNLWEYDNTKAVDLTNLNENLRNPKLVPVNGLTGFSNPTGLTVINDKLYFVGDCDTASNDDQLCYVTTSGGYVNVTNRADLFSLGSVYMAYFHEGSMNYIFFNGYTTELRNELFRTANISDPASKWKNVVDIYPGAFDGNAAWLTPYDEKLYFTATNGTNGTQLWSYDGTASPTVGVNVIMETNINTGGGGAQPEYLTVFDGNLYFSADDGTDRELWRFDGTTATEIDVSNRSSGSSPTFPVEYDGSLYFIAWDNDGISRLWRYDGSGSPEAVILPEDATAANGDSPFVFDGRLYFIGYDTGHGQEPWCYDGTDACRVADIQEGTGNGLAGPSFAAHNSRLYFRANDGAWGEELWTYYVK